MSEQESELLRSFRGFIKAAEEGATIPAVDEHDLKALHDLCVERAKRFCGKDGVISIELTARACSPGANLPAVWLRHTELRSLCRQGLLAEWQQGTKLDDRVFGVASDIGMIGPQFDSTAFLNRLRSLA